MLLIRRALAIAGASVVGLPLLATSCGAKSGLRDMPRDAGVDVFDAEPDAPDCVTDEDCATDDLCSVRQCNEGKCSAAVVTNCDDQDPCTDDSCKPDTGLCDNRPLALDQDGDGYKGPRPGFAAGAPGSCGDDCDDTNPKAHPGGTEVCDGVDNNCNGVIDEGSTYVPSGTGDVRVSNLDQKQAGRGGLAWNESFYAAAWTGQKSAWKTFVKGLSSDGSTLFGEDPITTVPSDTFTGPIVWTGNIFGTAWEDRRDADYEIYFNRLDAKGEKLGPDIRITNAPGFSLHATMVWNGAEFMLAWDDRRNGPDDIRVYGQRITVDGDLLGGNVELTGPADNAESPHIAEGIGTIAIAFGQDEFAGKHVAMRIFAPDFGNPGPVIGLSDDNAVDPSMVFNKDRYVIAYSKRDDLPRDAIWASVVDENGNILIKDKKITTGASFARTQWLVALGDRLLLVWADDHDGNYELYSQMMSPDLDPIAPRQRITFDGADTVDPIAVFGNDGDVGVLFDDDRSGQWQVYFNRLVCVAGVDSGG
jgi:Putative metal-binding motif